MQQETRTASNLPRPTSSRPPGARVGASEHPAIKTARSGPELIAATKPFTIENTARSWGYVFSTFFVLTAFIAIAAASPQVFAALQIHVPVPAMIALRALFGTLAGLTIVRAFILYHDFLHGALLRGSKAAKWVLHPFGMLILTAPSVWKATHNYHHAHTAKIVGSHVGSYAMVTTAMWSQMNRSQRAVYAAVRHPINVALAYFTVFGIGMCVSPFARNAKKHPDAILSLLMHLTVTALVIYFAGVETWFFAMLIPCLVAFALGAYLFYAQHNFPDILVQPRDKWSYDVAALESSSYLHTGPLMAWFTGNIGYHHVHHLNPAIPFYRLPEAMAAIPELQNPHTTTLGVREVVRCFSLKLWDAENGQMVGYPKA